MNTDISAQFVAETPAARRVLAERLRQIDVEGRTRGHDDSHAPGALAQAGACYAAAAAAVLAGARLPDAPPSTWPWHPGWWKPGAPGRMLEKAGALIIAALEADDRAKARGNAR